MCSRPRIGCIWLTSAGSANSYTYAVGLLTADPNSDLANPASWKKGLTPVLTYYSVDGEYGPGHNSFFGDKEGNLWIAYHGETDPPAACAVRASGASILICRDVPALICPPNVM